MKLRFILSLLALVTIFGLSTKAQETAPKVDIFAGYSYLQANPGVSGVDSFHLHGGSASIAYNYKTWLSGVADFGGYNNGNVLGTGGSGTLSTYLFGPRVSYRHLRKVHAFRAGALRCRARQRERLWHSQLTKCFRHERGRRRGLQAV